MTLAITTIVLLLFNAILALEEMNKYRMLNMFTCGFSACSAIVFIVEALK